MRLDGRRAVADGLSGAFLVLNSSRWPTSAEWSMKGPGAKPGGAFADRELAKPAGAAIAWSMWGNGGSGAETETFEIELPARLRRVNWAAAE